MLHLKSSGAHAAARNEKLRISKSDLVQVVADTFDANIASTNDIKSDYASAILLTQPQQLHGKETIAEGNTIKCLNKSEMHTLISFVAAVGTLMTYTGLEPIM